MKSPGSRSLRGVLRHIRCRLGWKLFLSYLVIILVGVMILASAAEFAVPTAFERHLAAMASMMGGRTRMMEMDLFANFRSAVTEALVLAGAAAFVAALILSVFVSRRVVWPVREMMVASQRIAEGHYDERVGVPGDPERGELDELALLALSFNQMATRLEQTEAMRLELIGNVAHELRTPLTSIKGYMEGLIDGVLPAKAATFQQVYREADRLQRLVHDLQELSRVEAGAFELELRPTPVSNLVEGVTARLGCQFQEKGVALKIDVPPDLPPVYADEDRIGQVLLNLVGNALQYTPPGGEVSIQMSVASSQMSVASSQRAVASGQIGVENRLTTDDYLLITVTDTGIGIAPEHLPHVFERFYRVDKSRSRARGGSGIGLTVARHLVEAHGGWIEAASEGPGRGSAFRFTLPVA